MNAGCLEEFVVGVYLVEQSLGVGVADLTALLHHLGHVTGHTQGWSAPFLLVLGWGQFDTLQVQSGTACIITKFKCTWYLLLTLFFSCCT